MEQAIEYLACVLFGNSNAGILHLEMYFLFRLLDLYINSPFVRRVFDGILDESSNNILEYGGIHDHREVACHPQDKN